LFSCDINALAAPFGKPLAKNTAAVTQIAPEPSVVRA
jgi:hypothetical protein